ncbi:dTDP-glucose 4,6-dehydratase [Actinoplanes sp. NPDC049681]|uniref:dTDP-glucose 4,6-dehydratase n=1 Tax=Actinoplanes sp. NPDC049681 TaxID=3363905 RepID=UPI003794D3B7
MNLLVTGGAGFIGSAFVRAVLADALPGLEGARVTVLDKLTYAGNFANLGPVAESKRLDFVPGDVCDAALVEPVVRKHDHVVHFAAESHVDRSIVAAAEFATTNVLGTQILLDAALRHGIERFVHVSTDEVYGSVPSGACTETTPLSPTSPYAATKAGADLLALAFHRTHGLPVTVTRTANTYGPYQHPEKLIPRFVTALLEGRAVPLYGDGSQVRDWVHVDDHCRATALVLTGGRPGEVYHVGGTEELTNKDLTELLLRECGADADRVEHVADRKGHDHRYALDDRRIRDELGYRPRVDFRAGLAETVQWYRDHPDWWRPLLTD